jgi:hypothetical protein
MVATQPSGPGPLALASPTSGVMSGAGEPAGQLARRVPWLGVPVRQLRITDEHRCFIALVDRAWPVWGLFIELDGEHHKDQPAYDARRHGGAQAVRRGAKYT